MPVAKKTPMQNPLSEMISEWVGWLGSPGSSRRPRAATTVKTYRRTSEAFAQYLLEGGGPTYVEDVTDRHVSDYLASCPDRSRETYFAHLQQFFRYLVAEEIIETSPLARMVRPKTEESEPRILSPAEIGALLASVKGKTLLNDVRDNAVIRLLYDSGARRSEVANLKLDDLDTEGRVAMVIRKGGGREAAIFGDNTAHALRRYLRLRKGHADAASEWLWLGLRGRLTPGGLDQMLERRGIAAGIGHVNAHAFRHTFTHVMKEKNASDEDLMTLGGWKTPQMLRHYGRTNALARAKQAHAKLSPGNDV